MVSPILLGGIYEYASADAAYTIAGVLTLGITVGFAAIARLSNPRDRMRRVFTRVMACAALTRSLRETASSRRLSKSSNQSESAIVGAEGSTGALPPEHSRPPHLALGNSELLSTARLQPLSALLPPGLGRPPGESRWAQSTIGDALASAFDDVPPDGGGMHDENSPISPDLWSAAGSATAWFNARGGSDPDLLRSKRLQFIIRHRAREDAEEEEAMTPRRYSRSGVSPQALQSSYTPLRSSALASHLPRTAAPASTASHGVNRAAAAGCTGGARGSPRGTPSELTPPRGSLPDLASIEALRTKYGTTPQSHDLL